MRHCRRVAVLAGIVLLHLGAYWSVTRLTALLPPDALRDFTTRADALIPHLPWTWPLYWIAYPFVVLAGGNALLRLPASSFRRAALGLAGMTVLGAAIQIAVPARAPWPADPAPAQQRFHDSALVLPYATLPSMHVAYVAFVAGVRAATVPAMSAGTTGLLVVTLVVGSTLTLKEHVLLDAAAGLALAGAALAWWRRGAR